MYVNICKEMRFTDNTTIYRVSSVVFSIWSLSTANVCIFPQMHIDGTVALHIIPVCRRWLSSSFSAVLFKIWGI